MVLGHAAGVLAALALSRARSAGTPAVAVVQDVPAGELHGELRAQGAMLDLPVPPAAPAQQSSCVLNRCVPHAAGADRSGCQFCNGLGTDEWLAPVADFAPTSATSTNITARRPTALQKALSPSAAADVPVSAGYSCGRSYLQHFRGYWICRGPQR